MRAHLCPRLQTHNHKQSLPTLLERLLSPSLSKLSRMRPAQDELQRGGVWTRLRVRAYQLRRQQARAW
jgi:hypothetical protein